MVYTRRYRLLKCALPSLVWVLGLYRRTRRLRTSVKGNHRVVPGARGLRACISKADINSIAAFVEDDRDMLVEEVQLLVRWFPVFGGACTLSNCHVLLQSNFLTWPVESLLLPGVSQRATCSTVPARRALRLVQLGRDRRAPSAARTHRKSRWRGLFVRLSQGLGPK